jgi:hypothetical protein
VTIQFFECLNVATQTLCASYLGGCVCKCVCMCVCLCASYLGGCVCVCMCARVCVRARVCVHLTWVGVFASTIVEFFVESAACGLCACESCNWLFFSTTVKSLLMCVCILPRGM